MPYSGMSIVPETMRLFALLALHVAECRSFKGVCS